MFECLMKIKVSDETLFGVESQNGVEMRKFAAKPRRNHEEEERQRRLVLTGGSVQDTTETITVITEKKG